jgi:sterol desaturase/sphingolipid hydroxylase (fatty acid hydroxylase superfamily)
VPQGPNDCCNQGGSAVKKLVFSWIQPVTLGLIVLFWVFAPQSVVENSWTIVVANALTTAFILALEFVNERHVGWRLNRRECLTDLFYVVLSSSVIAKLVTKLDDEPLESAKHALGITTGTQHLPFVAQVAFVVFLVEFGQYWMHRAMHNSFLWWTHAPHHHITQLNAMKGAVGNPIELFLVSLSVVALFDLDKGAAFCGLNVLTAVSSFAHANVRFDPPRWYSFFFTTIEAHSLHHSITYLDTRCNYANSLILIDHMCGTFRAGESEIVGQDERKRLSIREQFAFPFRPLLAMIKSRLGESASTAR